jgi:uncharacterized short protein YbdD (DUF466 family)
MTNEDNAVASPDGGKTTALERPMRTAFFRRLRDARQVCRQIFGIPDYDRYLAHAAARHPGRPVLSRSAYCAQAIEHKYGKGGQRCC